MKLCADPAFCEIQLIRVAPHSVNRPPAMQQPAPCGLPHPAAGRRRTRTTAAPALCDVCVGGGSAALGDRHVIAPRRAGVDLPRAADALLRILDHLLPLADP